MQEVDHDDRLIGGKTLQPGLDHAIFSVKNVVAHVGLSYCPARVIGVAASVVCSDLRK
ncbi:hypothetical protein SJA_C1-19600 [Sphingobium indicum UT26S]|uniref:Uncharacterized protein n=1 Tax=Sphingobium indicum (strain DSM 16413 / CCM 7287 / MTCC 6362 / UT26 / NBRC 101211 / UT26S) TaxID=452662 RepID=D4Z2G2_SPHIU|nr:hypothetical protein SJA_C1-19600 [Sphingobium indicum UT26S]